MTKAKHKREYGVAHKLIYVDPILHIAISRTGKTWGWQIVDINGVRNGRTWCVAKKEGYTDIRDAAVDAEAALIQAENL